MRNALGLLCAVCLLTGCFHPRHHPAPPAPPPSVTPDLRPTGRVALVDNQARFVVINFPPGSVPPVGQQLSVIHLGLKSGEVRITGPQHDTDTVADLINGDASVGDLVKGE